MEYLKKYEKFDEEKLFWCAYDIVKDEFIIIPENELDNHPNVTYEEGLYEYDAAKKEVDELNSNHKKRFIKKDHYYKVHGYNYDGRPIAKIEDIIITNKVYVKFYRNPKKYNYEIMEFIPI